MLPSLIQGNRSARHMVHEESEIQQVCGALSLADTDGEDGPLKNAVSG